MTIVMIVIFYFAARHGVLTYCCSLTSVAADHQRLILFLSTIAVRVTVTTVQPGCHHIPIISQAEW